MLEQILAAVASALHNQFVGGGMILMFTGSLIALVRNTPLRLWGWLKRQVTCGITIQSDDPLFDYVTFWLNSQERFGRARQLKATSQLRLQKTGARNGPSEIEPGPSEPKKLRVFYSPTVGRHLFRYRGAWMSVARSGNDTKAPSSGNAEARFMPPIESYSLESYGPRNAALLKELVKEIVEFGTEETEGVRIYTSCWGHWSSNGYVRMRPLSTVILPAGVAQSVVADMKDFRAQQNWYRDLGIPWHRGYLFHGLPGTGKTSLAAACAGELNMDIYLLNLSGTGMNDENLQRLMSDVRSGCMVVLEDIDCTVPDRDLTATASPRVTLSGLLNCLDGITSREGCLIVMTTNRRDSLDSALTRPGRVDHELEFGYADCDQIREFARRLDVSALGIEPGLLTMAEVQKELLERYRNTRACASAVAAS